MQIIYIYILSCHGDLTSDRLLNKLLQPQVVYGKFYMYFIRIKIIFSLSAECFKRYNVFNAILRITALELQFPSNLSLSDDA